MNIVVRKSLLALCFLMDCGHDVFFTRHGGCYAKHRQTGEEIEILRRGGQFETDAGVLFLIY